MNQPKNAVKVTIGGEEYTVRSELPLRRVSSLAAASNIETRATAADEHHTSLMR